MTAGNANRSFRGLIAPNSWKQKTNAYTLTEVLVVLVIIGILVLLALPNLMPLITRAKSTEAKLQLEHLSKLQQSYFFEHSKYTNDLAALGFIQDALVTGATGGKANYKIEVIQAGTTGYTARATAVVDFNSNGVFNVWQIDEAKQLKETTAD